MATFTNDNKTSSTYVNQSKNSSTYDPVEKAGGGWQYNEPNLLYNSPTDPDSGSVVYYNGIGTVTTYANQTKN